MYGNALTRGMLQATCEAYSRASTEPISVRVNRGAALLDKFDPLWPQRIDQASLHIADPVHCLVGQVMGDYAAGLERLQVLLGPCRFSFTPLHGFCRTGAFQSEYIDLRVEWLRAINERLNKQVAVETRELALV